MNRQRLSTWLGVILAALCAVLVAAQAQASDYSGKVTEEFHHTYPLSAGGRIELDNINGDVRITGWDQNQVKVDAVKYADTKEQLDDAKIEVESGSDYVSIHTDYHSHNHYYGRGHGDSASVQYTLMVPRGANLDEIKLVNGPLDIQGVGGEVRASCVNGRLSVQGLKARTEISSVNGRVEARFDQMPNSTIEISSVNGALEVVLPSDAKADIEASTVSGSIENDFGLHVNNHRFVGHDLQGELGGGGARIKLSNVNGRIEIRHANDGKSLSSAKDRRHHDDDDDDEI